MQVATSVAHVAPSLSLSSAADAPAASPGLVSFQTSLDALSSGPICESQRALKRIRRLKRAVWASGHLHAIGHHGSRAPVCWFVTLTYRSIEDWRADHVSRAIQRFRNWCDRNGVPCCYIWVAELQKRGAMHYHLLAWLPTGVRMPHWDRAPDSKRRAFWGQGMTNTEIARSGVGYLMKYLSKLGGFHRFPKGARLHGVGGLDAKARAVRSWFNLPEWVKCIHGVGEVVRRGCALVVRASGEILHSPWRVAWVHGGLQLELVGELPVRFHDGAYSTWPAAA